MEKMLHAYILSGPGEITRRQAREMAAAAVCEDPARAPCRRCRHCRKVFQGDFPGVHPDVMAVERGANAKGVLRQELVIDQIRALAADAPVYPNEAEAKVYLIPEADRMNPAAQNAFLKLLEEPPSFVRFLLCAENPERLLPTVRSRCAELRLNGETETRSDAAAERAAGYLDALGDPAALLRCALAMERLDSAALSEAVEAAMTLAPERGLPPAELLELEGFLRRAEEYLAANVGIKQVAGYLATFGCDKK